MSNEIWLQDALPGFDIAEDVYRREIEGMKIGISKTATEIFNKIKPLKKDFVLLEGLKIDINNEYFPYDIELQPDPDYENLVHFFMSADLKDNEFDYPLGGFETMIRCTFEIAGSQDGLVFRGLDVFTGYQERSPVSLPIPISERLKAMRVVQSALRLLENFDNVAQS